MNEKYCFKKMLELKKAFDEGSGAMFIIEQIAHDQREACASVVVDLLEQDHSYDEVFKITEAIHNAEIEATDE